METRETILKEIKDLAPALPVLPKETPYRTPEGYFEVLTEVVTRKTVQKQSGGTIRNLMFRWAAAAGIIGLISVGIYQGIMTYRIQQQTKWLAKSETVILQELDRMSENDLIAYLEIHANPGDIAVIEKNAEKVMLSTDGDNDEILLTEMLEELTDRHQNN